MNAEYALRLSTPPAKPEGMIAYSMGERNLTTTTGHKKRETEGRVTEDYDGDAAVTKTRDYALEGQGLREYGEYLNRTSPAGDGSRRAVALP